MSESDKESTAALSAAEKRERRKQRILAGGEKRMSAILNVDGEQRQAPCIEGASSYQSESDATSPDTSTSAASKEPIDDTPTRQADVPIKKAPRTVNFMDDATPQNLNSLMITRPKHMDVVDSLRFWIALVLGLLFAVSSLYFDQIGSILLPSILIIGAYEAFVFKTRKLFYPRNGNVIKAVLTAGMDQELLVTFGLLVDIFRKAGFDLLIIAFSFIVTKLVLSSLKSVIV